ncbi:MAG: N-formylglutamate amidohydrolase [Thermoanaerobaculales bacterium]|nr:N-formylglutamate amidohydrolase [Thermoanaerobaculales bacterium]
MGAPILVSVPHGGWSVPDELADIWALSAKDAFHDGDPLTSRIYDFSDRVSVELVMEHYRAVVDLNRAPDDIAPKNPDGVIKSHTCFNVEVYKPGCLPDEALKQELLERYYFPYHRALAEAIARDDVLMGVDCHSMVAVSPPIEADAGTARPLLCLGNLGDADGEICEPFNRITCPPEMIRFVAEEFTRVFEHEDVEIEVPGVATANVPFSGGYITRTVGGGETPFFQIEMSRALYLTKRFFDEEHLEVDERRINDLRTKVWGVLERTVRNL